MFFSEGGDVFRLLTRFRTSIGEAVFKISENLRGGMGQFSTRFYRLFKFSLKKIMCFLISPMKSIGLRNKG